MQATLDACYLGYYSDKDIDAARLIATDSTYEAAWEWIHDRGWRYFSKLREEEVAKEEAQNEEVCAAVEMQSGREVVQS